MGRICSTCEDLKNSQENKVPLQFWGGDILNYEVLKSSAKEGGTTKTKGKYISFIYVCIMYYACN